MRDGSADKVVLPVPDSPKNTAVSTGLPMAWLAEQCIAITPFPAADRFRSVEHRLLVLASYRRVGDQDQLFLEVQRDHVSVPATMRAGSALNVGQLITVRRG